MRSLRSGSDAGKGAAGTYGTYRTRRASVAYLVLQRNPVANGLIVGYVPKSLGTSVVLRIICSAGDRHNPVKEKRPANRRAIPSQKRRIRKRCLQSRYGSRGYPKIATRYRPGSPKSRTARRINNLERTKKDKGNPPLGSSRGVQKIRKQTRMDDNERNPSNPPRIAPHGATRRRQIRY